MRMRFLPTPRSVRGSVLLGFGVLIIITSVIVGGSVFTVREYQSDTAEMQKRANLSSELQTAEANGSVAALLLQRYVVAGDERLVTEIQLSAAAAVQSLDRASELARETDTGANNTHEVLDEISAASKELTSGAQTVISQRQSGDVAGAAAAIESIVPAFREFRLQLIDLANVELAEVDRLQAEADEAGDLALWLLIVSGVLGGALALTVAFMVSRSINGPLSRLEETALAVALGDTKARAPVAGPRELKRLAESLNLMTSTAHQRTEELRLSNEELRQRNRQLLDARFQASTDPLTGLLNHRTFHDRIKTVAANALRDGREASVIMIDIDNFKKVNDSLGHMAGDHVLREIASTICEVAGDQQAYRYGGDEFAILLDNVGRSEALNIADRILKSVKTRVKSEDGNKATISLGVASFPDMADSAEELLYRADMALNWAKSRGKNRVGGWDQVDGGHAFTLPQYSVGPSSSS
jgi:diguanylate cyclase (GGDEF)-like protein